MHRHCQRCSPLPAWHCSWVSLGRSRREGGKAAVTGREFLAFRSPPSPLGEAEGHGAGMLAVLGVSGILSDPSWQGTGHANQLQGVWIELGPPSPRRTHHRADGLGLAGAPNYSRLSCI